MKTDYVGTVVCSWTVGWHREAKIAFVNTNGTHDFVLTANVGPNVQNGDKYKIELKKGPKVDSK